MKFIYVTQTLSRTVCLESRMYIAKAVHVQGCIKVSQCITTMKENSLKLILTQLQCMKLNEIYTSYLDAQQNSLFKKWVYIDETGHVQEYTK